MAPAVEVTDLSRIFVGKSPVVALDNVTMKVEEGELFGLLGPNGAGKTTLIKILCTLLLPSKGSAKVLGYDVAKETSKIRPLINMVSGGEISGYGLLTVRENLWMFSQFYGIPGKVANERIDALMHAFGLEDKADVKVRTISTGQRQRMNIIRGFVTDPRLIFLDEPTLGLDITYRKRFYRRLLEDYMTEERTLLITTHQVDEIEFMLSDIMFIRDGELILHMQMETVNDKFTQLVVNDPGQQQAARAHGPVYEETRFGQTVMIFDGVDRALLEPYGRLSTPTLSDLFVALMQRPTANPEAAR